MNPTMGGPKADWVGVDLPHLDHLPGRVTLRSQHMHERSRFPVHAHAWHQFVYTISGILIVTLEHSWYILSPEHAMWLPSGIFHTTGALQTAEFRSLYVADDIGLGMPSACFMVKVTPLLRALIGELDDLSHRHESPEYILQVENIILAQLSRQPEQRFHLPWPKTPMLRKICEELYANPADDRSLGEWGHNLGASSRTLTRKFERDLGIGFREWRNRLRLFKAIDLLQARSDITSIALELGYSTPSAFSYMFRRQMGSTPTDWQRHATS